MRRTRIFSALLVLGLTMSGCGADASQPFYDLMRANAAFADSSDADLDAVAGAICLVVLEATEGGATQEEAVAAAAEAITDIDELDPRTAAELADKAITMACPAESD